MMLVFMGMVMMGLSGTSLGTGVKEHHNHEEHATLCGLLGATVHKWQRTRNSKAKEALTQAIFGKQTGGDLAKLKQGLPPQYKTPGNRHNWCGTCLHSGGSYYPGWSIPHDLICMCTVGSGGSPFTHKSHDNRRTPTLCGKSATDLRCEQNQEHGTGCHGTHNSHWWNDTSTSHETNGNGQVQEHLNTTWEKVVKPCLEKRPDTQALETLLDQLKIGDQQSPKWAQGNGYTGCNGVHGAVCVNYGQQCGEGGSPQWWKTLYEALTAPEGTRTKGISNGSSRKRTRRNPGGATEPDEPEEDGEEDEPEQTESDTTSTDNRQLPLLSGQQSSTSLTYPILCLLSATFFI